MKPAAKLGPPQHLSHTQDWVLVLSALKLWHLLQEAAKISYPSLPPTAGGALETGLCLHLCVQAREEGLFLHEHGSPKAAASFVEPICFSQVCEGWLETCLSSQAPGRRKAVHKMAGICRKCQGLQIGLSQPGRGIRGTGLSALCLFVLTGKRELVSLSIVATSRIPPMHSS